MYNFDVEIIEEVDGNQPFYKLIVNGQCPFDLFEESCDSDKYMLQNLDKCYAIMVRKSYGQPLAQEKFKKLKDTDSEIWEIKAKNKHNAMRVYCFKEKRRGMIVVLGSDKNTQGRDINKVDQLIKEYLSWKKGITIK